MIEVVFFFARFFLPIWKRADIQNIPGQQVGICMLLGHNYVSMGMYSLSSLFFQLGYSLPIYVFDDGSLTSRDKKLLDTHFNVFIESEQSSLRKVHKLLKPYPYFSKYRFKTNTSIFRKQIDICLLSPFEKFIYLDSDLLFLTQPTELQRWLKSVKKKYLYTVHSPHLFEGKNMFEYAFRKLLYKHLNLKIDPSFNAGMLCFSDKEVLALEKIEKMMKLFDEVSFSEFPCVSEALFSVLFAQSKYSEALPTEKYLNTPFSEIYWSKFRSHKSSELAWVHFSYLSKDVFPPAALKLAWKNRFFHQ